MKKLLISLNTALGLIGTPAFAADMAVKAAPPAPHLFPLGPASPTAGVIPVSFDAAFRDRFNVVRLGLNYRF